MGNDQSELSPIAPKEVAELEKEEEASWIVRKLAGSLTGRLALSSYDSIRAAGTSVVCLSPWGDSSPLILPCIRFRDLAMHAVIAGTGGMAAIAAPVMGPVSDAVISDVGDSIAVEIGLHAGFDLGTKAANDLIIEHPLKKLIPSNDRRLLTTCVKTLIITLKHKSIQSDAALGFFRSSVHEDPDLFSTVKDYLAIEKGWMNPILYASNRRPIIPRSVNPDIVFCHGPFLGGDYKIAQTLLQESATVISFCAEPSEQDLPITEDGNHGETHLYPKYRPISNYLAHRRAENEQEHISTNPQPVVPAQKKRRLLVMVLGIKPHRTGSAWSTSHRPGESVIRYLLPNGCPSLILPALSGCPLMAWDAMTLHTLHKKGAQMKNGGEKMLEGIVGVLYEYLSMCIDWDRIIDPIKNDADQNIGNECATREAVRDAIGVLVTGAVKSGEDKSVLKQLDADRAGIVMFRFP